MTRPSAAEVAGRVRQTVLSVDGVVDLDAGALGTFVTYGTGGRVGGVTVRDGDSARTVTVRVVAAWGRSLPGLADGARHAALSALHAAWPIERWRVDVEISDLAASGSIGTGDIGTGGIGPGGAA